MKCRAGFNLSQLQPRPTSRLFHSRFGHFGGPLFSDTRIFNRPYCGYWTTFKHEYRLGVYSIRESKDYILPSVKLAPPEAFRAYSHNWGAKEDTIFKMKRLPSCFNITLVKPVPSYLVATVQGHWNHASLRPLDYLSPTICINISIIKRFVYK